jgi:Plasmid pRiA4b ORF-3-like protein
MDADAATHRPGRPARRAGPGKWGAPRVPVSRTVHRVKITLAGSRPPIWRRLEISSVSSLRTLHESIQESFGWDDVHLWAFETPLGDFGHPNSELGHGAAATVRVASVLAEVGDRIRYVYDFGNSWEHEIVVEAISPALPGVAYPCCLDGRRSGPPENCGGMWEYQQMLEALADPGHPRYRERLRWLGLRPGQGYNPAAFDRDDVNDALSGFAKVIVKE